MGGNLVEDRCAQQPRLLKRNLKNRFFNQMKQSLQRVVLCSDFFLDKGGIALACSEYVLVNSEQGESTDAK